MKIILLVLLLFSVRTFAIGQIEGLDIISQTHQTVNFLKPKDGIQGTVLIFLSPLCPCSDSHTETIKNLVSKYKDFRFVGVFSGDETGEFREYFKMKDFNIPIFKDNKYAFADELGALATPHAFVINNKGDVIYKGGVTSSSKATKNSEQWLASALDQARAKKQISPSETRVLGCPIRD